MIELKSVPGIPGEANPLPGPKGGDHCSQNFRLTRTAFGQDLLWRWKSGLLTKQEMIEGIVRIKRQFHEGRD